MRTIFVALGSVFALAVGLALMVNALRYGAPFHDEYASLGARFVVSKKGVLRLLASKAIWLVPLVAAARQAVGTGRWHSWFGGARWGRRVGSR